jgi:hypothetical protein
LVPGEKGIYRKAQANKSQTAALPKIAVPKPQDIAAVVNPGANNSPNPAIGARAT